MLKKCILNTCCGMPTFMCQLEHMTWADQITGVSNNSNKFRMRFSV